MENNIVNNVETFELIAGYVDKQGTLHKDFDIREMNGSDEEAISKNEVKIRFYIFCFSSFIISAFFIFKI